MNSPRITFIIVLFSYSSYAQIELKGIVKDSSNVAIEFANVVLTNEKNEIVKGVITDEKGEFSLSAKKGTYKLSISFLGYKDWVKKVTLDDSFDFGIVILEESQNNLDEVVVAGRKKIIERKGDRIIFNVQNSILANGISGIDLLKNVPRIDPTSEGLRIIGKSNVQVLINGKILNIDGVDLKNYLNSLRSDNIEKIEVITSPSSKYDASGNSGLINILLKKKSVLGFDGSITSSYIQRTKPTNNQSLNLSYSNKKLIIGYNVFLGKENRVSEKNNEYFFLNETRSSSENSKRNNEGLSNTFNLDYKLTKNSNFGFYLNFNKWNNDVDYLSTVKFIENNTTSKAQVLSSIIDGKYNFVSVSPYYDIKLDSIGKVIKLRYNFIKSETDNSSNLSSENYMGSFQTLEETSSSRNDIENDFTVNSVGVDVELPLKSMKIEFGAKYLKFDADNNVHFFNTSSGIDVIDSDLTNNFRYHEQIIATYFSGNKSFGEKVYTSVGLRFESTEVNGNLISHDAFFINNYNNLFPNIFISYDPNDNHSYSLSYNRRIFRPTLTDLNPFRVYQDEFNYSVGNPNLMPRLSDNVEIGYTYKGELSIAMYVSRTSDNIAIITTPSNDNQTIITQPLNALTTYDFGSDISCYWKINNNLRSFNSFNLTYQKSTSSDANLPDDDLKGLNASISSNTTYVFNSEKDHKFFLNAFYAFPGVEEAYVSKNIFFLKLGANLNFLNKKININCYIGDLFNTTIARNTVNFQTFLFKNRIFNDNRQFNISLTYKFGNNKSKKARDINFSEKDRLKKEQ
ncbi:outer membrane beta-barrel family protein [Tenacibaculum tangerinum]|uniref:Outer membrane beta-barrel family protein n=1 Tax=Tenacibaculum tangerinum TaxID=3038772 RepID=A0ABY8L5M4_9FLAO|nr:outer membrane beta-barrel family protein [Tenacibaculum tangerinum]WGH75230.1 outer membrane beta-barrel family protein [Tenacibaculum tangerinum]